MGKQSTDAGTTRSRGTACEDLVARFLAERGYRIIKRNFHFGREGEIDIVALDGDVLVFIEVKARASSAYGPPEAAVTPKKQRTLRKAALGYCYVNGIEDRECRFDVVAVDLSRTPPEIRHISAAF